MAYYTDDLFHLRGRVIASRPQAPPDMVDSAINDRLRQLLDHRTYWADLLTFGVLSFPNPYGIGTVSVATGATTVTGVGTGWPVSDVVSTSIPSGVDEFGYVEVTPASMAGITENSIFYVDSGTSQAEIVPVVELRHVSFIGKFAKTHAPGCTATQSSLANLQFRLLTSTPIFTVAAVTSAATLELTVPWGGPPQTAMGYSIKLMYPMLASNIKALIGMKDEQTGFPVVLHTPVEEADRRDPRRALVSGDPYFNLVDLGANAQGNLI